MPPKKNLEWHVRFWYREYKTHELEALIGIFFLQMKIFKTNLQIYEAKTILKWFSKILFKDMKCEKNVYKSNRKVFS